MTSNCFLCDHIIPETNSDDREIYSYKCLVCGFVKITEEAVINLASSLKGTNYMLSAFTRQRTELKQAPIIISSTNALDLIKGAQAPRTLTEKLDLILSHLARKSDFAGALVPLVWESDYPLAYAKHNQEFGYFLGQLIELKLILKVGGQTVYSLTHQGWNRVEQMSKTPLGSKQVFVAMWFSDETKKAYDDAIYRAIDELGFIPLRIDLVQHNDKIDDRVIAEIRKSLFMVADFTGQRGGVYFETGFAMGLDIPVIRTCRSDFIESVHFDTRQYNHIVWQSEVDLYPKLKDRIEATIIR